MISIQKSTPKIAISRTTEEKKETYTEIKIRVFHENYQKAMNMIKRNPDKFSNVNISKRENELCIRILIGGTKILELFNDQIFYYQNNELTDFMKAELGKDSES